MSVAFQCRECGAQRSVSERLVGRQLRCPECDAVVDVPTSRKVVAAGAGDSRGTIAISPAKDDITATVMLEPVDVVDDARSAPTIEVSDPEPPPPPPPPPPARKTAQEEPPPGIRAKHALVETEMDMTPMVDVTFLLLIFFMVTAAFTMQKSLEVPNPRSDQASENFVEDERDDSDQVTVRVDEYNTYHVIANEWEEEAPSVQELMRFLRQAHDGDSAGRIPSTLMVQASGDALHEKVVAALDAGSQVGFAEVLLATIEDE